MDKWIPVSERLPKHYKQVRVYDGVDMFLAWMDKNGKWHSWDAPLGRCTGIEAWMPLSEPYTYKIEGEE